MLRILEQWPWGRTFINVNLWREAFIKILINRDIMPFIFLLHGMSFVDSLHCIALDLSLFLRCSVIVLTL